MEPLYYTIQRQEYEQQNNTFCFTKHIYITSPWTEFTAILSLPLDGPSAGSLTTFEPDALRNLYAFFAPTDGPPLLILFTSNVLATRPLEKAELFSGKLNTSKNLRSHSSPAHTDMPADPTSRWNIVFFRRRGPHEFPAWWRRQCSLKSSEIPWTGYIMPFRRRHSSATQKTSSGPNASKLWCVCLGLTLAPPSESRLYSTTSSVDILTLWQFCVSFGGHSRSRLHEPSPFREKQQEGQSLSQITAFPCTARLQSYSQPFDDPYPSSF